MEKPKKPQNPYDVELPQSIIESFARFLLPEIRKFYASEEGQREFQEFEKKNK
jgi:hypothetical protein